MDRITADINAAKEGMRVSEDVQRRNEGNISNLEMQVRFNECLVTACTDIERLRAILQDLLKVCEQWCQLYLTH